ncbi:hypothetical protein JNB11_01295 [Kocuria palustris]|nr:hypothetical protein [Kocuria palustris]
MRVTSSSDPGYWFQLMLELMCERVSITMLRLMTITEIEEFEIFKLFMYLYDTTSNREVPYLR